MSIQLILMLVAGCILPTPKSFLGAICQGCMVYVGYKLIGGQ